jgi:hypothetical protein
MLTVSATIEKSGAGPGNGGIAFLYLMVYDADEKPLKLTDDGDINVVGWLGFGEQPKMFFTLLNINASPIPGVSVWSLVPSPAEERWHGTTYFAIEVKPQGGDVGYALTQLFLDNENTLLER